MITLSNLKDVRKEPSTFKPQLTSLVDVMTILLVFLIKSFSAEGNLITPASDLSLPVSTSKIPVHPLNSIKITKEYLLAGDEIIATLSSFAQSDSLIIPQLNAWLTSSYGQQAVPAKELMIQSDKEISFEIVKKVMYTCSQAGKTDFTILAVREE